MPEQHPFVSVIMAAYNAQRGIRHTIETTLKQTLTDFEFIIIDDRSNDQTVSVIRSYHDKRIRLYLNEKNIGQTASLNRALRSAKGCYIARIDADDISFSVRLERQASFLQRHPMIDVVGSAGLQYDEDGHIVQMVQMPQTPRAILASLFFTTPLIHISMMARRQSLIDVGGYDESYRILADYALWSTLLQRGYRLVNIPDILVGYRVSAGSVGSVNMRGPSLREASTIIQQNARWLSGQTLTREQSATIWRYYTIGIADLTKEEIQTAEKILTTLLSHVGYPRRNIHLLFVRRSLRYLRWGLAQRPLPFSHLRCALHSFVSYGDGFFAPELAWQRGVQWYRYQLWKWQNRKSLYRGRILLSYLK